jgi:methyltransferase (TIGR00027 family)
MTTNASTETTSMLIADVSDTARWVAAHRAQESERTDALFHDRLAARLSGERGRAMAAYAEKHKSGAWTVVARTRLIDDLVLAAATGDCDCVLNLAAGLDTRPYRLALPGSMHWIEADLPAVVKYKGELLKGEKARCQLTRVAVDLSDTAARRAFLDACFAGARRVLVLSEGLLCYLSESTVRELATDLQHQAAVKTWVFDLLSPAVKARLSKTLNNDIASAPLQFAPPQGVAYFEALGWHLSSVQSIFRAAARYRRLPLPMRLFALLPDADPRNPGERRPWAGVVQMDRATG